MPPSDSLSHALNRLKETRESHSQLAHDMIKAYGGEIYYMDLFTSAALNRSIAQCKGFAQLMEASNLLCAGAMLRLQLDIAIRYFASCIAPDTTEFASNVHKGTHIRSMRDRHGNKMTDKHLCTTLGQHVEWVPHMYEKANSFVHLSDSHMHAVISPCEHEQDDGTRNINLSIGSTLEEVPEQIKIEMVDEFRICTMLFLKQVADWIFTKSYPHLSRLLSQR